MSPAGKIQTRQSIDARGSRRDTSIRGDVRRGTGIINNELYVGVRVWNHKHYVTDPGSGKSVTCFNPESE